MCLAGGSYDVAMTFPGQPAARPKRKIWPILLLIGACLVGCAVCGVVKLVTAIDKSTKPSSTVYHIGDRAPDGDLAFKVTSVNCDVAQVGDALVNRRALGTFCVVTLDVENIGDKATMFLDSWQKGYDSASGREYSVDSAATLTAAPSTWLAQLNPGASVTSGVIVFDVPAGTRLSSIVLHDGAFSGGVRITLQ